MELADLKEVYGGDLPVWWQSQGGVERDTELIQFDVLQRRFSFTQVIVLCVYMCVLYSCV